MRFRSETSGLQGQWFWRVVTLLEESGEEAETPGGYRNRANKKRGAERTATSFMGCGIIE